MDAVGALNDITDGLRLAPLWSRLGWEQTVARFRRTVLGPFWLTANLLAISFALAFVTGALMGGDYRKTFALIVGGVLTWSLIGGVLGEAAGIFITSASLMHTMKLPLSFHVLLMMHRAFINFLAQLLAFWLVLAVMRLGALPTWPLLISLPLSIQVLFFLTPIFWAPTNVHGPLAAVVKLNPLAHLLELVREPLLGRAPTALDWDWGFGILIVQAVLAWLVLALFRKRVVFWL